MAMVQHNMSYAFYLDAERGIFLCKKMANCPGCGKLRLETEALAIGFLGSDGRICVWPREEILKDSAPKKTFCTNCQFELAFTQENVSWLCEHAVAAAKIFLESRQRLLAQMHESNRGLVN